MPIGERQIVGAALLAVIVWGPSVENARWKDDFTRNANVGGLAFFALIVLVITAERRW
jgi:hypothetical protein